MTIALDPRTEALVRQKVESGRFADTGDVIREAMRLLDERDRLDVLRSRLGIGEEQIARGEGRPFTPEIFEEIKRIARRKAGEGHGPNPDVCP